MKNIIKFVNKFTARHKRQFFIYIIFCFLSGLIALAIPYLLGQFIDGLTMGSMNNVFYTLIIAFAICTVLDMFFSFAVGVLYAKLQILFAFSMESKAYQHLHLLPYTHGLLQDPAYLSNRLNNDSNLLSMFYLNMIQQTLINILKLVIPTTFVLRHNLLLGSLLLVLNMAYYLVYTKFKNPLKERNEQLAECVSEYFSEEYVQASNTQHLQMNGLNIGFYKRLEAGFKRVFHASISEARLSQWFSTSDSILHFLAHLALLVLGGLAVIRGELSIGYFTILLAYFNMMMEATKFFFSLGEDLQERTVFYQRMEEIFESKPLINGSKTLDEIRKIEVRDLSFDYNKSTPVFQNMNNNFQKGEIIALKGGNGSGKSTFIRSILGLHLNEEKGELTYNGMPASEIDMNELRKHFISVCEQKPDLLPFSIRENLTMGNENVSEIEVMEMLKEVNLDSFVKNLPDGLDTIIKPDTTNLSGGQKQRFALARTFLRDTDVLIFDEPSSALDIESKVKLISTLERIKKDKIIFLSTHDDDLIKISDKVMEF